MADNGFANPIQRFAHLFQRIPLGPLSDRSSAPSGQVNDKLASDLEKSLDGAAELDSENRRDQQRQDVERRRDVRTLPPWIHSMTTGEDHEQMPEVSYLLPNVPNSSHPPHHPFVPTQKPGSDAARGKLMDAGRSKEPTVIRSPFALAAPKWQAFTRTGDPLRYPEDPGQVVDDAWTKENFGDLDSPWNPDGVNGEPAKDETLWLLSNNKRAATIENLRRTLMKNAFVPLIIRVTVLLFVLCALGLGVTIYRESNELNQDPTIKAGTSDPPGTAENYICAQQTSTYMSFIVDAVAVIYLVYITWDEYTSKPLGLRRSRDKIRLLFLDLIFIVFSAANTSLAFNTLADQQWACYDDTPTVANLNQAVAQSVCVYSANLCARQRALCAMLVIALTVWFLTFSISVLRVIDRISH